MTMASERMNFNPTWMSSGAGGFHHQGSSGGGPPSSKFSSNYHPHQNNHHQQGGGGAYPYNSATVGGSSSSNSSSSFSTLSQDATVGPMAPAILSKNRYGREEMLALCPEKPPHKAEYAEHCPDFYSEDYLPPICYLPYTETEERLLVQGVNSSKVMNVVNHADRSHLRFTVPRAGVGRGGPTGGGGGVGHPPASGGDGFVPSWAAGGGPPGMGGGRSPVKPSGEGSQQSHAHPPGFGGSSMRGRGRIDGRGGFHHGGNADDPYHGPRPGRVGAGEPAGSRTERSRGLSESDNAPSWRASTDGPASDTPNPRAQGLLGTDRRGRSGRGRAWVPAGGAGRGAPPPVRDFIPGGGDRPTPGAPDDTGSSSGSAKYVHPLNRSKSNSATEEPEWMCEDLPGDMAGTFDAKGQFQALEDEDGFVLEPGDQTQRRSTGDANSSSRNQHRETLRQQSLDYRDGSAEDGTGSPPIVRNSRLATHLNSVNENDGGKESEMENYSGSDFVDPAPSPKKINVNDLFVTGRKGNDDDKTGADVFESQTQFSRQPVQLDAFAAKLSQTSAAKIGGNSENAFDPDDFVIPIGPGDKLRSSAIKTNDLLSSKSAETLVGFKAQDQSSAEGVASGAERKSGSPWQSRRVTSMAANSSNDNKHHPNTDSEIFSAILGGGSGAGGANQQHPFSLSGGDAAGRLSSATDDANLEILQKLMQQPQNLQRNSPISSQTSSSPLPWLAELLKQPGKLSDAEQSMVMNRIMRHQQQNAGFGSNNLNSNNINNDNYNNENNANNSNSRAGGFPASMNANKQILEALALGVSGSPASSDANVLRMLQKQFSGPLPPLESAAAMVGAGFRSQSATVPPSPAAGGGLTSPFVQHPFHPQNSSANVAQGSSSLLNAFPQRSAEGGRGLLGDSGLPTFELEGTGGFSRRHRTHSVEHSLGGAGGGSGGPNPLQQHASSSSLLSGLVDGGFASHQHQQQLAGLDRSGNSQGDTPDQQFQPAFHRQLSLGDGLQQQQFLQNQQQSQQYLRHPGQASQYLSQLSAGGNTSLGGGDKLLEHFDRSSNLQRLFPSNNNSNSNGSLSQQEHEQQTRLQQLRQQQLVLGGGVVEKKPTNEDAAFGDIHKDAESLVDRLVGNERKEGDEIKWFYKDPQGKVQGPFTNSQMLEWFTCGYFTLQLLVKRITDPAFYPLGHLIRKIGNVPFLPKSGDGNSSLTAGSDGGASKHNSAQQQFGRGPTSAPVSGIGDANRFAASLQQQQNLQLQQQNQTRLNRQQQLAGDLAAVMQEQKATEMLRSLMAAAAQTQQQPNANGELEHTAVQSAAGSGGGNADSALGGITNTELEALLLQKQLQIQQNQRVLERQSAAMMQQRESGGGKSTNDLLDTDILNQLSAIGNNDFAKRHQHEQQQQQQQQQMSQLQLLQKQMIENNGGIGGGGGGNSDGNSQRLFVGQSTLSTPGSASIAIPSLNDDGSVGLNNSASPHSGVFKSVWDDCDPTPPTSVRNVSPSSKLPTTTAHDVGMMPTIQGVGMSIDLTAWPPTRTAGQMSDVTTTDDQSRIRDREASDLAQKQAKIEEERKRRNEEQSRIQRERLEELQLRQEDEKRRRAEEQQRQKAEEDAAQARERKRKQDAEAEEQRRIVADNKRIEQEERKRTEAAELERKRAEELKKQQKAEALAREKKEAERRAKEMGKKSAPWAAMSADQGQAVPFPEPQFDPPQAEKAANQPIVQQQQASWKQSFPSQKAKKSEVSSAAAPWSSKPKPPVATTGKSGVLSLAQIQAEEERQILSEQRQQNFSDNSVTCPMIDEIRTKAVLGSPVKQISSTGPAWGGKSGAAWGGAASAMSISAGHGGFWEDDMMDSPPLEVPVVTKSAKSKKRNAKSHTAPVTKSDGKGNENAGKPKWNLLTSIEPELPQSTFTTWCKEEILKFNTDLDAPTFISFLLEIETGEEISEFVEGYLGSNRQAREFAKNFVIKRKEESSTETTQEDEFSEPLMKSSSKSEMKNASNNINSSAANNHRTTPAATSILGNSQSRKSQQQNENDSSHNNSFDDNNSPSSGVGGKRNKKKAKSGKQIDLAALGFRTAADPNRVNAGEIDLAG